jgi:hypothetical protein
MAKKIMAWVLLAGFVLLLLNIMFFKYYLQLSLVVYIIISFGYLLYSSKARLAEDLARLRNKEEKEGNGEDKDL